VNEVLDIVKKDAIFYRRSEGGITVGGGEPLAQGEFVKELLRRAKEVYGIHTVIETCAYTRPNVVMSVLKYVDFIFCDLKYIDPVKHRQLTGVSNEQILNNIRLIVGKLLPEEKELVIRVPIIPKLNDDLENLLGIAEFIKSLDKNIKVELLPYHELGKQKYKALDRKYPLEDLEIKPPSKEYIEKVKRVLVEKGIRVVKT
jgi:pyruvate formate lyase activating enzyme